MVDAKKWMKVWAVALVLTVATVMAHAQTSLGSITGEVTDQQKAVIVGAVVTITNLDRQEWRVRLSFDCARPLSRVGYRQGV